MPLNCMLKNSYNDFFKVPFKEAIQKKKVPANTHFILSTKPDQDVLLHSCV